MIFKQSTYSRSLLIPSSHLYISFPPTLCLEILLQKIGSKHSRIEYPLWRSTLNVHVYFFCFSASGVMTVGGPKNLAKLASPKLGFWNIPRSNSTPQQWKTPIHASLEETSNNAGTECHPRHFWFTSNRLQGSTRIDRYRPIVYIHICVGSHWIHQLPEALNYVNSSIIMLSMNHRFHVIRSWLSFGQGGQSCHVFYLIGSRTNAVNLNSIHAKVPRASSKIVDV